MTGFEWVEEERAIAKADPYGMTTKKNNSNCKGRSRSLRDDNEEEPRQQQGH
jgi:hypothetical protein